MEKLEANYKVIEIQLPMYSFNIELIKLIENTENLRKISVIQDNSSVLEAVKNNAYLFQVLKLVFKLKSIQFFSVEKVNLSETNYEVCDSQKKKKQVIHIVSGSFLSFISNNNVVNKLTQLTITECFVNQTNITELLNCLEKRDILKYLDLSSNKLCNQSYDKLKEYVFSSNSLSYLDVSNCNAILFINSFFSEYTTNKNISLSYLFLDNNLIKSNNKIIVNVMKNSKSTINLICRDKSNSKYNKNNKVEDNNKYVKFLDSRAYSQLIHTIFYVPIYIMKNDESSVYSLNYINQTVSVYNTDSNIFPKLIEVLKNQLDNSNVPQIIDFNQQYIRNRNNLSNLAFLDYKKILGMNFFNCVLDCNSLFSIFQNKSNSEMIMEYLNLSYTSSPISMETVWVCFHYLKELHLVGIDSSSNLESLKNLKNLVYLNLAHNDFDDKNLVLNSISNLTGLLSLNLHDNQLTEKNHKKLHIILHKLTNLKIFIICNNNLSKCEDMFVEHIQINDFLETLIINSTKLDNDPIIEAIRIKGKRNSISSLSLSSSIPLQLFETEKLNIKSLCLNFDFKLYSSLNIEVLRTIVLKNISFQELKVSDMIPKKTYIANFVNSLNEKSNSSIIGVLTELNKTFINNSYLLQLILLLNKNNIENKDFQFLHYNFSDEISDNINKEDFCLKRIIENLTIDINLYKLVCYGNLNLNNNLMHVFISLHLLNKNLLQLDLYHIHFNLKGVYVLSELISESNSLSRFGLKKSNLGDANYKIIHSALIASKSLKQVLLLELELTSKSSELLYKLVKLKLNISVFCVGQNKLNIGSIKKITKGVIFKKKLDWIDYMCHQSNRKFLTVYDYSSNYENEDVTDQLNSALSYCNFSINIHC